jgi:lipase maturation factor 1
MHWIPGVNRWLFDSERGPSDRMLPRWIFLRALGGIYFSAFFSLVFQIRGLIGPQGILPAGDYLHAVNESLGHFRGFWYAPTLLWFSVGPHMLTALCWVGMIASLLLVLNFWPRGMLFVCFVCYLSFVAAAQDFSGYQSDGMLLEAGFICLFFAPRGLGPGLGRSSLFARASLFLLLWEWFRIYFESGVAKIMGGDPEWRNYTAMDEYYQNGPLPTWIGWYLQHLPHWFHASTVFATLVLELVLVWMILLPRRWRIVGFFIVTAWQLGVILTANYTFLNYLVLALGFLLLDDRFLSPFVPLRWRSLPENTPSQTALDSPANVPSRDASEEPRSVEPLSIVNPPVAALHTTGEPFFRSGTLFRETVSVMKRSFSALILSWIFYASTIQLLWMFWALPLPTSPVAALEPFRIANRYGLFGIMTRDRYEIEFQGSDDGKSWTPYPFRFKPQDPNAPPGIYAPYQPRFDWNLWFASLGAWQDYPIVPRTEICLLSRSADVLGLLKSNPFQGEAALGSPHEVRAVLWQYWFTSMEEKRKTGAWWRRQFIGLYAPTLERQPDGTIQAIEMPTVAPRE